MLKLFALPLAIQTLNGCNSARFPVTLTAEGERWGVIRGSCGSWLAALLPGLEPVT